MKCVTKALSGVNKVISRQTYGAICWGCNYLVIADPSELFLHKSSYFAKYYTAIWRYWMLNSVLYVVI